MGTDAGGRACFVARSAGAGVKPSAVNRAADVDRFAGVNCAAGNRAASASGNRCGGKPSARAGATVTYP